MTKTTSASKYVQALNVLNGETVVAHDRRKGAAPQIDHLNLKVGGGRTLVPEYGTSDRVAKTLTSLATEVYFDAKPGSKTGRPMPHYFFRNAR